jgi:hypothetical protein
VAKAAVKTGVDLHFPSSQDPSHPPPAVHITSWPVTIKKWHWIESDTISTT